MRTKTYTCDDCGARGAFTSYVKARAAGWAVAKDYEKCYCPTCAPAHRNGGANNPKKKPKAKLEGQPPQGFVQISIKI